MAADPDPVVEDCKSVGKVVACPKTQMSTLDSLRLLLRVRLKEFLDDGWEVDDLRGSLVEHLLVELAEDELWHVRRIISAERVRLPDERDESFDRLIRIIRIVQPCLRYRPQFIEEKQYVHEFPFFRERVKPSIVGQRFLFPRCSLPMPLRDPKGSAVSA